MANRARQFWRGLLAIALLLLATPSGFYLWRASQRPRRTALQQAIAPGITYERWFQRQPRPMLMHLVSVDLRQPGLEFQVTPGEPGPDGYEVAAQTGREFLQASGADVAINGSFFQPFYTRHPLHFYPRSGDRVDAIGQAIAAGEQYSEPQAGWPVFCVAADGAVAIALATCPPESEQAIAGSPILVWEGEVIEAAATLDESPRPRSALGIDASGDRLWLLVADGRQPFYSGGATLGEVAELLRDRGAATVLGFDGGGSSTLVRATPAGPRLLNAPIHTRIPNRERPVANHLGIRSRPSTGSGAGSGN